jgi:tetratricopeptide (TPR) repeat protein
MTIRSLSRLRPFLLMLTAFIVLGLAADASAQSRGRARISGRVTDAAGNPIAGAKIVLTFVSNGDTAETMTGDDGRFNKGSLGRGDWNIDVIADGYLPVAMSARLSEEVRLKPLQIELTPGEAPTGGSAGVGFSSELGEAVSAANALFDAGDLPGAYAALTTLLGEFDPDKDKLLYLVNLNAGNAAYAMQDFDKATMHYRAVLAQDEGNTDARLGVANIFMMNRDIDSAMTEIGMIDTDEISDPVVFYNIGSLLFDQGQSANAATYYELALQRNPNFGDAHMQLALCFIQQGKMEESKPHLHKVIELDPESPNAALAQDFLNSLG